MSSDGVGAIFWEGAREEHITPLFGYAGISGPVVVVVFRDRIKYVSAQEWVLWL